jgi:hypothetical protein
MTTPLPSSSSSSSGAIPPWPTDVSGRSRRASDNGVKQWCATVCYVDAEGKREPVCNKYCLRREKVGPSSVSSLELIYAIGRKPHRLTNAICWNGNIVGLYGLFAVLKHAYVMKQVSMNVCTSTMTELLIAYMFLRPWLGNAVPVIMTREERDRRQA